MIRLRPSAPAGASESSSAAQTSDAIGICLTSAELRELTRHRRCDAQRRELDFLGLPYRVRRDGSLVVLRSDLGLSRRGEADEPPEPELMP